jgi:hypothetical protein
LQVAEEGKVVALFQFSTIFGPSWDFSTEQFLAKITAQEYRLCRAVELAAFTRYLAGHY